METEPEDGAEVPAFALRRLVFENWGVPFARTAEQLAAEAKAAGFDLTRVASTFLGRVLVLCRPREV